MGLFHRKQASFYPVERVSPVIEFDGFWRMDLIGVFPSIVAFGVSFPFDEILEHPGPSMMSVAPYQLHFVFCFPINQFRRRSGEVWAM